MTLIKFMGATMTEKDNGEREYQQRGPVWINPDMVAGVYDHTILISGNRIRVMQNLNEILAKLRQ